MINLDEIKSKLESILTPKRFVHSVNVMNTSLELAKRYGEDVEKACIAGLLHDCARDIRGESLLEECKEYGIAIDEISSVQPNLLHGALGERLAREIYGVEEEYVLRAIRYHTTGCKEMSLLDKIVFLADYIEPRRSFPGVEDMRKLALADLDKSIILALERTIRYVIEKGALVHPDTVEARNSLILKLKKKQENGTR